MEKGGSEQPGLRAVHGVDTVLEEGVLPVQGWLQERDFLGSCGVTFFFCFFSAGTTRAPARAPIESDGEGVTLWLRVGRTSAIVRVIL